MTKEELRDAIVWFVYENAKGLSLRDANWAITKAQEKVFDAKIVDGMLAPGKE